MKKVLPLFLSFVLAAGMAFLYPSVSSSFDRTVVNAQSTTQSIIPQEITGVTKEPHEVTKIFDSGNLIGVISDRSVIDNMLDSIYRDQYEETFPNSDLDIGKDVYTATEMSYYEYDDIDDQICEYLTNKDLFTIRATAVEFSNEEGVYAVIYVQNQEIYEDALMRYLSFFVDKDSLQYLLNNVTTPQLTTYGSRDTSIQLMQNISTKQAYTSPSEIMTSSDQVLEYLEYGDNEERNYYTVVDYDTVQGVASKVGLTTDQIIAINNDVIKSSDQVLTVGQELCITYFESPIDVVVTKDAMKKEEVYAESALYIEDDTLTEGKTEIRQLETVGSKNALYTEQWINGVLVSGTEVSSIVTVQPQQEIIAVGTKYVPGIGTGIFRWPVDNPHISCYWGCYYGHRAIDIQNAYDRYGPLYAADNGTIIEAGYNSVNGNYVVIDHGNGYQTYYGHMNVPCFYGVGDVVEKGEVIGQIGMTGKATGPHTHFFIMHEGVRLNPCDGFLAC